MVPLLEAIKQTNRFACLAKWADLTEPAKQELTTALSRAAANLEHCSAIVDRWIRANKFVPTPSDLYELADAVIVDPYKGSRNCELCDGTGYMTVWLLVTYGEKRKKTTGRLATVEDLKEGELIPAVVREMRKKVDGINQAVAECAAPCTCPYGSRLELARKQREAMEEQGK